MKTNRDRKPRPTDDQISVTAIASILHRVSGVITGHWPSCCGCLVLHSASPEGFESVVCHHGQLPGQVRAVGILTALAYHIVGGLRHLVMDMGHWEELESGNQSARVAFVITRGFGGIGGVLVW